MPAYFNMSLEFQRKDIYATFTSDFQELLQKAGVTFQGGYAHSENNSLEEILSWNQKHLEDNFKLGFREHYSADYKQMLFTYGDFSEVRGFWMNQYPVKSEFTFELIIPETEILEYYDDILSKKEKERLKAELGDDDVEIDILNIERIRYKRQSVDLLIDLALSLWKSSRIQSIQTELEISCGISSVSQIKSGRKMPLVHPFAIVSDCFWEQLKDNREYQMEHVHSEGILLKVAETQFY